MKWIVAVSMLILVSLALAQTTKPAIMIDGKLDEWTKPAIYLTTLTHSVGGVQPDTPEAAAVWIGRDDAHLYVAANVHDPHLLPRDCIEFTFDFSEPNAPRPPVVFRSSASGEIVTIGEPPLKGAVGSAVVGASGYTLEASIPLVSLGVSSKRLDEEIGFDVIVHSSEDVQRSPRAYALSLRGLDGRATGIGKRLRIDDAPPASVLASPQLTRLGDAWALTVSVITVDRPGRVHPMLWANLKSRWGWLDWREPVEAEGEMLVRRMGQRLPIGCTVLQHERRLQAPTGGCHVITSGLGETSETHRLWMSERGGVLLDREPVPRNDFVDEFATTVQSFHTSKVYATEGTVLQASLQAAGAAEVLWTWSELPDAERPLPVVLVMRDGTIVQQWPMERRGFTEWRLAQSCRELAPGTYEVALALQAPGKPPVVIQKPGKRVAAGAHVARRDIARLLHIVPARETSIEGRVINAHTPTGTIRVRSGSDALPGNREAIFDNIARNVWDMQAFGDRIYIAGGNPHDDVGPTEIQSFGLGEVFPADVKIPEGCVDYFRVIGDTLMTSAPKPRGEAAAIYGKREGAWLTVPVPGAKQISDVLFHDGVLYAAGRSADGAAVFASKDAGATWSKLQFDAQKYDYARFVALGVVRGKVIAFPDRADEGVFELRDGVLVPHAIEATPFASLQPNVGVTRVTPFKDGVLYLPRVRRTTTDREPPQPLLYLDDLSVGAKKIGLPILYQEASFTDIVVRNDTCYALMWMPSRERDFSAIILSTTDLREWKKLAEVDVPAIPMSLEFLEGRMYIGVGSTEGARLAETGAIYRIE